MKIHNMVKSPFVGKCSCHVKNSGSYVKTLRVITVGTSDFLVGFDVASSFTRVPFIDTLNLLKPRISQAV